MHKVALVSSSPLVLAGLRAGLEQHGGFDVVAACASLEDARDATRADALILEADAAAPASDIDNGAALVVLADDADHELGEWLARGVTVLPRDAAIDTIAAAVHAACAGLVATPATWVAHALLQARHGERMRAPAPLERLTAREHEVLAKMSQGLGNREIASALRISPHTAKFHVAQIIGKLDASSRAHAVAQAYALGLLPPRLRHDEPQP